MTNQIKELVSKYSGDRYFTFAKSEVDIEKETKERLGLDIPKEYLEFLNEYGHGGLDGFEVLGIGMDKSFVFIDVTLDYRNDGLPNNLIVIENCDEWLYCIDCESGEIVAWDYEDVVKAYPSFDDYFLDRCNDSIENM